MTIDEIRKNIAQLNSKIEQIGKKSDEEDVNLEDLTQQLNELIEQKKDLENKYMQKKQLLDNCNTNSNLEIIDSLEDNTVKISDEEKEKREAQAYTNIWAKTILNKPLNENERLIFNRINKFSNDFTHTTQNTPSLIPETVVKGIWKIAEEAYPLYNDIKKFSVEGVLKFRKHLSIESGDAAFYDENTATQTEENTFDTLSLSGCELAKSVTVSWKMKTMAIDDFINFIIREIGDRMGVALGTAIAHGKGKPASSESFPEEPLGIVTALEAETGTPQILSYSNLSYKDFTSAISLIHSSYSNKISIYANNKTIWNQIANILDANKRPIFMADAISNNGVGRILGKVVKTEAGLKDGEILFADAYDGYVFNVNKPMTMHTEDHVKQRETDYMGYTVVDGAVFDNRAFALLKTE